MFIFLFLISLVALIVGLVRPNLFSKILGSSSRKRVGLILGSATLVLLIIAVATTPTTPRPEQAAEQVEIEPVAEAPQTETPISATTSTPQAPSTEERIKAIAFDDVTTDISYRSFEDQKGESDRPAGSRTILVSLNLGGFSSASSMYRGTGEITSKVFREAFTNPNVYDVIVWYYGDATDQYGNKKNKVVLSQAIDKVTFLKIAWDNFDTSKLCEFLRSEGRVNGGQTTCVALVEFE